MPARSTGRYASNSCRRLMVESAVAALPSVRLALCKEIAVRGDAAVRAVADRGGPDDGGDPRQRPGSAAGLAAAASFQQPQAVVAPDRKETRVSGRESPDFVEHRGRGPSIIVPCDRRPRPWQRCAGIARGCCGLPGMWMSRSNTSSTAARAACGAFPPPEAATGAGLPRRRRSRKRAFRSGRRNRATRTRESPGGTGHRIA